MKKIINKILVLGDIHLPYPDWNAIEEAYAFNRKFKADLVVQVGDLIDAKAWSTYSKDTDDLNPEDEWQLSYDAAHDLADLFPDMVVLTGNHEARIMARATDAKLPKQLVKSIDEALGIPGWKFYRDSKPFQVNTPAGPTIFIHGDEMAGNLKAKICKLGMNVVHGHTHQGEIVYSCNFEKRVFGMDVGCMADLNSKAMSYAAKNPTSCFVGFGYINDGVPHLVPT